MKRLLESISERDRRALAIRFLRSTQSMSDLLQQCKGDSDAAMEARKILACVALMIQQDAPVDLVMTDAPLYRRLRERITDLRTKGWG